MMALSFIVLAALAVAVGGDEALAAPAVVFREAYCTEARAELLGVFEDSSSSGARISIDLRLSVVAENCGSERRCAESVAGRDVDEGLEICVLWVETGGAERHSSKCYAMEEMPRLDVAISPERKTFQLLAWPRYSAEPAAVAGGTASLTLASDLRRAPPL